MFTNGSSATIFESLILYGMFDDPINVFPNSPFPLYPTVYILPNLSIYAAVCLSCIFVAAILSIPISVFIFVSFATSVVLFWNCCP